MLDVAAVAMELLETGLPRALAADLLELAPGVPIGPAELALVVACHDLGKLTPGFASKVEPLRKCLVDAGATFPDRAVTDHAQSTAAIGPDLLERRGAHDDAALLAIAAVAGHHGRFHGRQRLAEAKYGGSEWQLAREGVLDRIIAALKADPARLCTTPSERWLMALAGLTVVADWIGSDADHFPYHPGEQASPAYLRGARQRARSAIASLGWSSVRAPATAPSFSELFPGRSPLPMQQTVIDAVNALDRPGLLIVEAPTGGGKTEAAIYAAESMMARFGLGGFYFGLPTQATSNQMFERVRAYLEHRYTAQTINLHLLHSNSSLNPDYRALRTRAVDGQARTDASVLADAWFLGRKRGLLSPFAVGTVDQAMMAALRSRHFFLRMLGLARKVLIVDEVHAYDAFMSPILGRLLCWLRTLGSGVILLSATLPAEQRARLLRCWHTEPQKELERPIAVPYPRCIAVGSRAEHRPIPRTPETARRTELKWIEGDTRAIAQAVIASVRDGGCAAWIHNTVSDAQCAFAALRELGWPEADRILFHARFPTEDRLQREQNVLALLSRGAARPQRLIVVATQVLEQSLDVDFDAMFSELAPIDLLIQRAGRLHRHPERDARRREEHRLSTLHLHVGGSLSAPNFGASAFVYDEHVLLRTWWTLHQRRQWTVPEESDALMEAVYPTPSDLSVLPEGLPEPLVARWLESADKLQHALKVAEKKGTKQLVPRPGSPDIEQSFLDELRDVLDDPEEAPHKHVDVLAKTRDIEASATLVCLGAGPTLSPTDSTPVPFGNDEVPHWMAHRIVGRSLNIQHRSLLHALTEHRAPPGWRRTALLRYTHPIIFDTNGLSELGDLTLRLDPELGLVIRQEGKA